MIRAASTAPLILFRDAGLVSVGPRPEERSRRLFDTTKVTVARAAELTKPRQNLGPVGAFRSG
ncbi:MAG: hypothetical protein INR72_16710 [Williamsia herbipolensis]|nr:hypothetical protein [Williamsia herbipolensis]